MPDLLEQMNQPNDGNSLLPSPMQERLNTIDKASRGELMGGLWADGVDTNVAPSSDFGYDENGVWTQTPESVKRIQDELESRYDKDFLQSTPGAVTEGVLQATKSLGATALDLINWLGGPEVLSDYAHWIRLDNQNRMNAYQDDTFRRNIVQAVDSVTRAAAFTGLAAASGGTLTALGLPTLGGAIGSSSMATLSLGYGLNQFAETYDEASRILPKEQAVKKALFDAAVEGGITALVPKITGRSVEQAIAKPFYNMARTQGLKEADALLHNARIPEKLFNMAREYAWILPSELTDEGIQGGLQLASDAYFFDRDISPEQAGMVSKDIFLTTLFATGMSTAQTPFRIKPAITPRTNDTFDIAQMAYDGTQPGGGEKLTPEQRYSKAADLVLERELDVEGLQAVSEVFNQFASSAQRRAFDTQVIDKVRDAWKMRDAVEQKVETTTVSPIPMDMETGKPKAELEIPATESESIPQNPEAAVSNEVMNTINKSLTEASQVTGKAKAGKEPSGKATSSAETTRAGAQDDLDNALEVKNNLALAHPESKSLGPLSDAMIKLQSSIADPETTLAQLKADRKAVTDRITKAKAAYIKAMDLKVNDAAEMLNAFGLGEMDVTPGLAENRISEAMYNKMKAASVKMADAGKKKAKRIIERSLVREIYGESGLELPEDTAESIAKDLLTGSDEGDNAGTGVVSSGNLKIRIAGMEDTLTELGNSLFNEVSDNYEVTTVSKGKVKTRLLQHESLGLSVDSIPNTIQIRVKEAANDYFTKLNEVADSVAAEGMLSLGTLSNADPVLNTLINNTEYSARAIIGYNSETQAPITETTISTLSGFAAARSDALNRAAEARNDPEIFNSMLNEAQLAENGIRNGIDRLPLNDRHRETLLNTYLDAPQEVTEPNEDVSPAPAPTPTIQPVEKKKATAAEVIEKSSSKKATKQVDSKREAMSRNMLQALRDKRVAAESFVAQVDDLLIKHEGDLTAEQVAEANSNRETYVKAITAIDDLLVEHGTGTMTPQKFSDAFEFIRPTLPESTAKVSDKFIKEYTKSFGEDVSVAEVNSTPMWSKGATPLYGPGGIVVAAYYGKGTALGRQIGEHIQVDKAAAKLVADANGVSVETVLASAMAHEGSHVTLENMFDSTSAQDKAMSGIARDAANILELQELLNEVKSKYGKGMLPTNRSLDGVIGEELLAHIGEAAISGKRKLSAPEQNLWNKFKLTVRHWLLKSGYGKKLGMKWEGRDLDYFAYKLLADKGYTKVDIFPMFTYDAQKAMMQRTELSNNEAMKSIADISKTGMPDESLIKIAQGVLASADLGAKNKRTFGDFLAQVQKLYGADLGGMQMSQPVEKAHAYLKTVWDGQVAAEKAKPKAAMQEKAEKQVRQGLGRLLRQLKDQFPDLTLQQARDGLVNASVPDGIVDIRTAADSIVEKYIGKEVGKHLGKLNEAGITLTRAIADHVRQAYLNDWRISDVAMHQKISKIADIGTITSETLQNEIADVVKRRLNGEKSPELTAIEHSLQDQLQRTRNGKVVPATGPLGVARDIGTRLWTKILKASTIEGFLNQAKVPERAITAIKATGSIRPLIYQQLLQQIEPTVRKMAADKETHPILMKHAVLYAEGHPDYLRGEFRALPENVQKQLIEVGTEIRAFYDKAQEISNDYGISLDFPQHKIAEMESEIDKLTKRLAGFKKNSKGRAKVTDRVQELYNRVALMQATHFVSIPRNLRPEGKGSTELKGRKTLSLYSLIKTQGYSIDDLNTVDILVEYMDVLGRDIALRNIAEASELSGMMKPNTLKAGEEIPEGWVDGNTLKGYVFSGKLVDAAVAEAINHNILMKDLSAHFRSLRSFFNIMKAKEFTNPMVMNAINMFQGTMLGVLPLQGVAQAYKDVKNLSPEYLEAIRNNAMSRPSMGAGSEFIRRQLNKGVGKWQMIGSMVLNAQAMKEFSSGDLMQGLRTLFHENTITGIYKASTELAWAGDEVLRMAAYSTLKKRGYSPETAAKYVARVYVDYADLPVPTRKYATLAFFTPVYAFETIRGITKNAIDAATALKRVSTGNASIKDIRLGVTALGMLAVGNIALDALMQMTGYERDEEDWWDKLTFGYKYVKPHVTKEGLQKELAVRMAGPYIVLQRELNRFMRGISVETPLELPGSMFKSYATMQHPLFRNLAALFNMEDRFGNPMFEEHDDDAVKFAKSLKVTAIDWVPMLQYVLGSRGFVSDDAREAALGNWYNAGTKVVLDLFAYPAIRGTKENRILNNLKYQRAAYLSSVRTHFEQHKPADDPVLAVLSKNYEEKANELIKELEAVRAANR